METACKEFLLELLSGQRDSSGIPDYIATDPQAIDWMFHLLHTQEFPPHDLIQFLWKHYPDDRRFRLWKNRAFRPGLGEDGMISEKAYQFLEKHEPHHPWLDPFMEQAAYDFYDLIDGAYHGKDFSRHLKKRFERRVETHDPESDISEKHVTSNTANLKPQFVDSGATPELLVTARRSLVEGKDLHLAFKILLAHCSSNSELVDLFESSVELKWPGKSFFLEPVKQLGNSITPATFRRIVLFVAEENHYSRLQAVPMLLARLGDDAEVVGRIKSWAGEASDDFIFSKILSSLLDANRERKWVREIAMEFQKQNDGSHHVFDILARIGDDACVQVILNAFDSPLASEVTGAIHAAGIYLHADARVRERLIETAIEGGDTSIFWIARRYPHDPATQEVLAEVSRKPGRVGLIQMMCIQRIQLHQLRERFLNSLRDPSTQYHFDCSAILALRPEREALASEVQANWERLSFHHAEFSSIYPMWYSWEPVMDQVIDRIRSGSILEYPREIILQISECADVSAALRDGIRAAADKLDLSDAILLLALIYGDRPETIGFLMEFIEYEPAMKVHGAEVAFAEVIRLGKREEDDFQWALTALLNSRRGIRGIASYGPRILVHFFGRGPHVVEALQGLALSSDHPPLADSSMRLLLDEFPDAVPVDIRSAVEKMSSERRANYFLCLGEKVRHHLDELMHFSLQDPEPSVRKAALLSICRSVNRKKVPDGWSDRDFATKCLQYEELAGLATGLLAKWHSEDETVARILVTANRRFPNAGISLNLAESFGHTQTGRQFVFETVRNSRDAAATWTTPPRCTCPGCLGFDLKEYVALMLRLHFPPFDQLPEAKELTRNILTDPWLQSCETWRLIPAVTYGLEDAETLLKYEEIIRSEALKSNRKAACEALAKMAGRNDDALQRVLDLLENPDEKLRMLAAKSSRSISLNERRSHRKLHELLMEHDP